MVVPQFPPEMIARIQYWAEAGKPPAARKKIRATFELVNKEWKDLVDHFTFTVVTKPSDIARLSNKLQEPEAAARAGARARVLRIDMAKLGKGGHVVALSEVVEKLVGCQVVKIVNERGWGTFGLSHALGELSEPGATLLRALGALGQVTRFQYECDITWEGEPCGRVTDDQFRR